MGHYRSEMYSEAELEAEEKAKLEEKERRVVAIQKKINKMGLARFLAEMEVSTHSGKIWI